MLGGFPPAPRWAWIVMVLGLVTIGVLSYLTVNRPPPPAFTAPESARATETAARTAPTSSASASPAAAEAMRVLVVGDGLTAATPGAVSWPALLEQDLAAAGRTVDVTATAAQGSGYAQAGPGGITFAAMAEEAGGDFDLVVFFGSRHDIATAADVTAAAEASFAAARSESPAAGLVVIGPAWPGPSPPGYILTNRDALAAAVGPSTAAFVDPLAEGWFVGSASGFLTADGQGATAEGHRYLADLIRPVVEGALPAPS